jgi:hypothetical protein
MASAQDLLNSNVTVKYPYTGMVLTSEFVTPGGLIPRDPEFAPMTINMEEMQILYERAITAEYENKKLRRKILGCRWTSYEKPQTKTQRFGEESG